MTPSIDRRVRFALAWLLLLVAGGATFCLQNSRARMLFLWFGGHSASKTPDPIPNSAVKCCSADGTAS